MQAKNYHPPTLSRGRARPSWPEGRPGPTLIGPGSGQNFGGLARPAWGQGPEASDMARPGPTRGRPGPARHITSPINGLIKV